MSNNETVDQLGQIIKRDYFEPLGISESEFARRLNINKGTISLLFSGKRPMSTLTALKLSRYFGKDLVFFINLRSHYDYLNAYTKYEAQVDQVMPYGQ